MIAMAPEAQEPQTSPIDLDAPMDVNEAAKYLKVEPETLHAWRRTGKGPRHSMLGSDGRTVRYTMRDLNQFMVERRPKPKKKK